MQKESRKIFDNILSSLLISPLKKILNSEICTIDRAGTFSIFSSSVSINNRSSIKTSITKTYKQLKGRNQFAGQLYFY